MGGCTLLELGTSATQTERETEMRNACTHAHTRLPSPECDLHVTMSLYRNTGVWVLRPHKQNDDKHTHTHTHTYTHTHARTHTRTHTHAHTHRQAHAHAHTHTHTHTQTRTSTRTHAHAHTHAHTHNTHTHTHTWRLHAVIPPPTHTQARTHTYTRTHCGQYQPRMMWTIVHTRLPSPECDLHVTSMSPSCIWHESCDLHVT